MMATQQYPTSQYGVTPNSGRPRNVYHIDTGAPQQGMQPGPMSAGAYYHNAHAPQQVYINQHDMSAFGLVTPPTTAPAQFGSPLVASGSYGHHMVGTPTQQWSMNVNALALSPAIGSDGTVPTFFAPSPMMGSDPHGDVFSTGPQSAREPLGAEGLGFHGMPQMTHHHMYGMGQLGVKPGHHLMLDAAGNPAPEIKKRSRTAQACERCRIRKARCFGGNPCNRCTKRRFVCEFSTAVRQRGPSKPQGTNSAVGPGASSTSTTPTNASSSTAASLSKSATSTDKPGRRHSLPGQPGAAPSFVTGGHPPMPQKGYSTADVGIVSSGDQTPMAYSVPSSTVIPHLPTPAGAAEYLNVPGNQQQQQQHHQHPHHQIPHQGAPVMAGVASRPHSDSYYPSAELCSPVFAFTPESSEPATSATSVSADYPYTPISPATNFSPSLGMTAAVPGQHYAPPHPHSTQPRQQPIPDGSSTDGNVWYPAGHSTNM